MKPQGTSDRYVVSLHDEGCILYVTDFRWTANGSKVHPLVTCHRCTFLDLGGLVQICSCIFDESGEKLCYYLLPCTYEAVSYLSIVAVFTFLVVETSTCTIYSVLLL